MLAVHNPFYRNVEANARQQLQQQILSEAQRKAHQTLTELTALKSLLSYGQICLCIPVGNYLFPLDSVSLSSPQQPEIRRHSQSPKEPSKHNFDSAQESQFTKETKLRVSLHCNRLKTPPALNQGDCKFCRDSVEIVIDMRGLLPADIFVNVEERLIRVDVARIDKDGAKNYWKSYELPACVSVELTKCVLSHDGFLQISVPWHRME